jgi:excisionase family DNA binding protein
MDIDDKLRLERREAMDLSGAQLLNVAALAKLLDLSPVTIRQWAKERKIPCIRLGTRVLFSADDVQWILDHNHVAAAVGTTNDDAAA